MGAGRIFGIVAVAAVILTGCGGKGEQSSAAATETFVDSRDGKKYKTVKIGSQTWMAKNLNFDGSGKCHHDKILDSYNCWKYGRLYTWDEAMAACPAGWRLPGDADWMELADYAGGEETAGKKLKSKTGWKDKGNGTDEYGFSALPGGGFGCCSYTSTGVAGYWWTAAEDDSKGVTRDMYPDKEIVGRWVDEKTYRYSVRCLKEEAEAAEQYDEDGQGVDEEEPLDEKIDENGVRTIYVSNASQFLRALGSECVINMKPGLYNLTSFTLERVNNLTIRGAFGKDGEKTEIVSHDVGYYVGYFRHCSNIVIENIKAGHNTRPESECAGGVFLFENSSNIRLSGVDMYGSGIEGLSLMNVSNMKVTDSRIYECTERIMSVGGGGNISFEKCRFHDNKGQIGASRITTLSFTDCEFSDNGRNEAFSIYDGGVTVSRSKFTDEENVSFELEDFIIDVGEGD